MPHRMGQIDAHACMASGDLCKHSGQWAQLTSLGADQYWAARIRCVGRSRRANCGQVTDSAVPEPMAACQCIPAIASIACAKNHKAMAQRWWLFKDWGEAMLEPGALARLALCPMLLAKSAKSEQGHRPDLSPRNRQRHRKRRFVTVVQA